MNKRTVNLIVAGAVLFFASSVFAQINTEDKIELTRTYIEANRQVIVTAAMELTEEESTVFWPAYKAYRADIQPLNDRFLKVLQDYAEHYEDLSDEKAAEIMSEYLDIEEDRVVYKKLHVERMMQILPMTKVVRFFQTENKMEAVIKFDLATGVPFAGIREESKESK
jgi:hypothetical protein